VGRITWATPFDTVVSRPVLWPSITVITVPVAAVGEMVAMPVGVPVMSTVAVVVVAVAEAVTVSVVAVEVAGA